MYTARVCLFCLLGIGGDSEERSSQRTCYSTGMRLGVGARGRDRRKEWGRSTESLPAFFWQEWFVDSIECLLELGPGIKQQVGRGRLGGKGL